MGIYSHPSRVSPVNELAMGPAGAEVMLCKGIKVYSVTVDPSSLVDAAGETKTIAAVGVSFGDIVLFAAPYSLQGITVTAYVQAADQIGLRIQNESAGTLDLSSGTWTFVVLDRT